MTGTHTVPLKLPEEVRPSRHDLEVLQATLQAIVTLRYEHDREWEDKLREMESEGWAVSWRLAWVAEATREGEHECASGRTLNEVFIELHQLARLDMVGHCP